MSFSWKVAPEKEWPEGAARYARAVRRGLYGIAQRYAPEIAAWMKSNKVWEDRTSNAVQTLHTEIEPGNAAAIVDTITIYVAHGVFYGYYLEGVDPLHGMRQTLQGERYAIIRPAIEHFAPRIWADVRKMMS